MNNDLGTINQFVGLKIKELRLNKGWTQEQLAKKIGISKHTLQKYENNIRKIKLTTLHKIANIFELDIDFFFPNEEKKIINDFNKELLDRINKLDPDKKELVIKLLDNLSE